MVQGRRASSALHQKYTKAMAKQRAELARQSPAARRDYAAQATRMRAHTEPGDPIGRLVIDRIDLDAIVVRGSRTLQPGGIDDTLHAGPAQIWKSAFPGQGSNTAIAGHRTTYTHPFWALQRMKRGDLIKLYMPYGTFTYAVRTVTTVQPDNVSVAGDHGHEELTLSTCTPRFTAARRLIVHARLVRTTPTAGART